jgi:hypothetical protein
MTQRPEGPDVAGATTGAGIPNQAGGQGGDAENNHPSAQVKRGGATGHCRRKARQPPASLSAFHRAGARSTAAVPSERVAWTGSSSGGPMIAAPVRELDEIPKFAATR